jgi:hypothetical protein
MRSIQETCSLPDEELQGPVPQVRVRLLDANLGSRHLVVVRV